MSVRRSRGRVKTLFRVAAGPRLGFGHLVRSRVLARALGTERYTVSLRGPARAAAAARRLGARLVRGTPRRALRSARPDVLIIDDPSRSAATRWRAAGSAHGVPVVSIHDLGIAFCGADLAIDGSLARPPARHGVLCGPAYAILDQAVVRARGTRRDPRRILIALGGGARAGVALRLARALRRARPGLRVRIAGGFMHPASRPFPGVVCLGPRRGLATEFAACGAAITGGGVSLYEAVALDTPVVAWPVVRAQLRTARAFDRRGLAVAVLPGPRRVARTVAAVLRVLEAKPARRTHAIDGFGATRAAAAVAMLVARFSRRPS